MQAALKASCVVQVILWSKTLPNLVVLFQGENCPVVIHKAMIK